VAAAAGCCASTPLGEKKPNSLVAAAHAVTAAVEAAEGEAAHAARVGTLVRKLAAVAAVQRRSGHADMASAATAVAQLHKNKGGAHVTAAAVLGDQRHALLKLLLSRCGPSLSLSLSLWVLGDQRHALLQLLLSRCGPSLSLSLSLGVGRPATRAAAAAAVQVRSLPLSLSGCWETSDTRCCSCCCPGAVPLSLLGSCACLEAWCVCCRALTAGVAVCVQQ
jgi:hypothetical protein